MDLLPILVGGIPIPLKNTSRDDYSQYMGKNVPNHQPVIELSPKGLVLLKALRECLRDSLRAAYAPAVLAYAQVE